MSRDDIIYTILLLLGILFGNFYRKILDVKVKQLSGTVFGISLVLFTSNIHSFHVFFSFLISSLLIKQFKEKCHLLVFWFMMIYLLFFRTLHLFGIPTPPGHTNMIHMIMVLKVIGLAFERNSVYLKSRDADKKSDDKNVVLTAAEQEIQNISILDMIHYSFNYIGLLTGPYYTYKTYHDFLHMPFAANADCWKFTLKRLKWVPVYSALFLGASYIWPIDYALSDEFYIDRSWLYRLFYVWPSFFIFRMRIYSGILLSECICISAGLGAYPKELDSKCGHGPSKEITAEFIEKPEDRDYDFETVENIKVAGVEQCLTFREAMKHWNRCVQYWMAMYIYKRFPNKKYRVMATMAVSAYWHGVHAGHYFCILGPIFYLPLEDLYVKVFPADKGSPLQKQITAVIYWILKFFAFSYMGTAFLLKDAGKIWFYYKSVYHFAYVFWAIAYLACFLFWKQKKQALKRSQRDNENSTPAVETKKLE